MSLTVGDQVQLDQAIGTIEKVREDGITAEVLWDTGARCPLPLAWLSDPEERKAEDLVRAQELRRQEREEKQRRELPERECACACGSRFTPTRTNQLYKPGHRQHRQRALSHA